MGVISIGIQKQYKDEIRKDGIATQKELNSIKNKFENPTKIYLPIADEDNSIPVYSNGEWKIIKAYDPQEGLTVVSLPYYWDDNRNKYLDNTTTTITYYLDSDSTTDEWMFYIPNIISAEVSHEIFAGEKYCIVGVLFKSSNKITGDCVDICNITGQEPGSLGDTYNYDVMHTISFDDEDSKKDETLDIVVKTGTKIAARITDSDDADKPVIRVVMRKIWEEQS